MGIFSGCDIAAAKAAVKATFTNAPLSSSTGALTPMDNSQPRPVSAPGAQVAATCSSHVGALSPASISSLRPVTVAAEKDTWFLSRLALEKRARAPLLKAQEAPSVQARSAALSLALSENLKA